MELWQILTLIMTILAGFFGIYWLKAKGIITELGILIKIISDALADDTLTKEELQAIVAEINKILASLKKETVTTAVANLQALRSGK